MDNVIRNEINTNEEKQDQRVRVGEPGASVSAGDYNMKTGGVYRLGMFAPTIDELAMDTMSAAEEAGVLPSNLPIYDENGNIDEQKINLWNPNQKLVGLDLSLTPNVDKVTAAGMTIAMDRIGKVRHITHISADDQDTGIVSASVSRVGGQFAGNITVHRNFNNYIYVPLVPKIAGRTQGLSISSYAIFHAAGHLLYALMNYDARVDLIGEFMAAGGWKKRGDLNLVRGSFMGKKSRSSWRRNVNVMPQTEAAKWSPSDDFAEAYALWYTNQNYLSKAFPEKYEAIDKAIHEYGNKNVL